VGVGKVKMENGVGDGGPKFGRCLEYLSEIWTLLKLPNRDQAGEQVTEEVYQFNITQFFYF